MSRCVPSWDFDDHNPNRPTLSLRYHSNSTTPLDDGPKFEVAELTWENGQLAMHGLGQARVPIKRTTPEATIANTSWEKPCASGTLESLVNQATASPPEPKESSSPLHGCNQDSPVHRTATPSATMTMDALVPCSNLTSEVDQATQTQGQVVDGLSTCVGSCSATAATTVQDKGQHVFLGGGKRPAVEERVTADWSSRDDSFTGSATCGMDSTHHPTLDTCETDLGVGSPERACSPSKPSTKTTTTANDHDSVCHSSPPREAGDQTKKKGTGKFSTVSTKRSRAAAIHNQSERKRRDKINQRISTLQKLVPNSSKTDKASMLDEVIEYLKQLQAQVQVMSRMNMQPAAAMMLPMTMQQLPMPMMTQIGMGMGMGFGMAGTMGMDMNNITINHRSNITGAIPPPPPPPPPPHHLLHPTAFMPIASWTADVSGDRFQPNSAAVIPDPLSTFLSCQSQGVTMEAAYSKLAALYQQQQQPPPSSSKS